MKFTFMGNPDHCKANSLRNPKIKFLFFSITIYKLFSGSSWGFPNAASDKNSCGSAFHGVLETSGVDLQTETNPMLTAIPVPGTDTVIKTGTVQFDSVSRSYAGSRAAVTDLAGQLDAEQWKPAGTTSNHRICIHKPKNLIGRVVAGVNRRKNEVTTFAGRVRNIDGDTSPGKPFDAIIEDGLGFDRLVHIWNLEAFHIYEPSFDPPLAPQKPKGKTAPEIAHEYRLKENAEAEKRQAQLDAKRKTEPQTPPNEKPKKPTEFTITSGGKQYTVRRDEILDSKAFILNLPLGKMSVDQIADLVSEALLEWYPMIKKETLARRFKKSFKWEMESTSTPLINLLNLELLIDQMTAGTGYFEFYSVILTRFKNYRGGNFDFSWRPNSDK